MTTADDLMGGSSAEGVSPALRAQRARTRAHLLRGCVIVIIFAGMGYAFYEWLAGPPTISTDDAYVGVVLAQVTPQIDGIISAIDVHDTQYVHKGDVLVSLDPRDAQLDFDEAQATYEGARRRVDQEMADANGAQANVLAKQSLAAQAEQQLRRRTGIRQAGVVAAEEVSNARSALEATKYALSIAEQQLAAKRAIAGNTAIESNPEILAAKARLEKCRLRLQRTLIRAPVDGIVAQSHVQIGQQIAAGAELMTVVPIRQVYVDANFKESQIKHIRPGQLVTLTSDIYGSSRVFHGHVDGVGGGTGAAFAIIPPQNATGNWIKVVQRVPVRISIDPAELMENPLRVGISMTVEVHLDRYVAQPTRIPSTPTDRSTKSLALRSASSGTY